jgi:hypothetical protein
VRIPSRQMPQFVRKPLGVFGWVTLAALSLALVYLLLSKPAEVLGAFLLVLLLYGWAQLELKKERLKLQRLAEEREGQSICEFARDFDFRQVDTWVIRAVYENLQAQLEHVCPAFPIRAHDRLKEDLRLDPDDIDLDLLEEVEQRTKRSLTNVQANPYYGRVETVNDLVLFFQAQPKQGGEA